MNIKKVSISRQIIRIIMIIYSAIVIYPLIWTVLCSLKTNMEFFTNIYGFPKAFQFQNYVNAWVKAKIGTYFYNTFLITIVSVTLIIIMSTTTSYCLARYKFRFCKTVRALYIAGLLIPTMAGIVPLFVLLKKMSMLDNRFALIILYSVYALPFSILLMMAFFTTIPKELEEAATIDGCTYYKLFGKIMMPMAMPGIITLCIFQILYVWNEFTFSFIFISSEYKRTLQIGLANLQAVQYQRADWATLFAGVVIVMLPTIIMYLLFQKRIQEGITLGAIK